MRFAISLLVADIAIASIIGTVLKQRRADDRITSISSVRSGSTYSRKLGSVFCIFRLVVSADHGIPGDVDVTVRDPECTPRFVKDMRSWRDHLREQSLRNFHHHAEWQDVSVRPQLAQRLAGRVSAAGYRVKIVEKEDATLVTAKCGAANKWGYIFAHSAIVIICLGGLLDSDLPIRLQQWIYGKTPFKGNGVIADIPERHRLGLGNPTFRGMTRIPEGSSSRYCDHSAAAERCIDPGSSVHDPVEEIRHRFLFDRHAEAVRQRSHRD
jgi:cytochrome c biogenesis protein